MKHFFFFQKIGFYNKFTFLKNIFDLLYEVSGPDLDVDVFYDHFYNQQHILKFDSQAKHSNFFGSDNLTKPVDLEFRR